MDLRLRIDVPVGWRRLGDATYLVQSEPRATLSIGAVRAHNQAAAELELLDGELVVDATLTARDGRAVRMLVVDDGLERRWIAWFARDGVAAIALVRAAGQLRDLEALIACLSSGAIELTASARN
jgi:hypothetical protein